MNKHIRINGHKLPVNVSDTVFMDRLTTAQEAMQTAMNANAKEYAGDEPHTQYKRAEADVEALCVFFDTLYGAGTADRVFHRTNDAAVYLKALQEFNKGLEAAVEAFTRRYSHTGTLKFGTSLKRG